jgi:hypothetical protein
MYRFVIILFFACACSHGQTQNHVTTLVDTNEVLFSVADMQQDFNQMRQTLENEHCCLYEYTSKNNFDSLFQHQYDLITSPLHPNEFYNILSPITAKIGCMHTAIWMPSSYWERNSGNLFPFYYASRYGFPEKYTITYALPGRKTRVTEEIEPATDQAVRTIVYKNFRHPPLTLEIQEDKSTTVMTIPTFIYYDRVDYFKNFLDSSFSVILAKKIQNLILDLRGNDGGDPFCSVPLLSYLEKEPVPYYAEPYGRYAEFAKPIPMAEKHFTGNLYVLLDGYCGSTNGHFSALLKYNNIGKFVGTPSGATYKCNAGRDTEINLDRTGMILTFGRTTYAAAVTGMDKTKPIMPDFPVEITYNDFLNGKDVFMEKALMLIDGQNKY